MLPLSHPDEGRLFFAAILSALIACLCCLSVEAAEPLDLHILQGLQPAVTQAGHAERLDVGIFDFSMQAKPREALDLAVLHQLQPVRVAPPSPRSAMAVTAPPVQQPQILYQMIQQPTTCVKTRNGWRCR